MSCPLGSFDSSYPIPNVSEDLFLTLLWLVALSTHVIGRCQGDKKSTTMTVPHLEGHPELAFPWVPESAWSWKEEEMLGL